MGTTGTTFSKRCDILGELWIAYRDDETFEDFIDYNDLGLPLAYAISKEIAISTSVAETMIDETWELFLGALGLEEDKGYETLNEVFGLEAEEENADNE
jgi:hypothetical protein